MLKQPCLTSLKYVFIDLIVMPPIPNRQGL